MNSWGDERGIREGEKKESSKKKPWDCRKGIDGKVSRFQFDRKEGESRYFEGDKRCKRVWLSEAEDKNRK